MSRMSKHQDGITKTDEPNNLLSSALSFKKHPDSITKKEETYTLKFYDNMLYLKEGGIYDDIFDK